MTQISTPMFFQRPMLMSRIRRALELPLLCIVAPIGYGKTLTAREALPADAVWQTLVSDSPAIFWEKVGAFLRPYTKGFEKRVKEMGLPASETDLDELLSFFDALSLEEPVYFVLDDCHVLPDVTCWRFIELLARRRVRHLHVVLLSRGRPLMALEDLKLKGLASEIGSRDLAFSAEDILGFFRQNGLMISAPNSQELFAATNGWISAVCLYAMGYMTYTRHMQEMKGKGSFSDFFSNFENEQMYRLLEETVYRTCSEDEQKFLIALCGLDTFTLDALDFIMERIPDLKKPPREILHDLLVYNSFVRKNTMENVYEIHPILLFFLRKRLQLKTRTVQDFLYAVLGDWFIHVDAPVQAMRWYLEGHQYDRMLNLVVTRQEVFNDFANKELLIRCFGECPPSIKRKHILSCLLCAKSLLLYCEPSLFKRTLFDVQSIVNALPPGAEKNWAQGELEILLAFTCFEDLQAMYDHLMRATLLMGGRPSRVVGKDFPFGFGCNALITLMYRDPGSLDQLNETFAEIMPIYRTLIPGGGDGALELLLAETAYCRGEWNRSYDLAHDAMDKAMESDQIGVLLMDYHLLIHLALIHGDYRAYEQVQKEIQRAIQYAERRELRHSAEVTQAGLLLLADGDPKQVPNWILHGRFFNEDLLPPVCLCAYIRYGRVLLLQKSYALFLSFYRDMENIHRRYPSNIMMIFADIFQAAALAGLGDMENAEKSISSALHRAEEDRIYIPFIENLELLEKLLPLMKEKAPDFTDAVCRLHKDYEKGVAALAPALSLSRLFTDRENQILTLLKRGYTNKQIAAELFIAEITVKKNLARIAEKLGVKGRMNILRALSENERHPAKH